MTDVTNRPITTRPSPAELSNLRVFCAHFARKVVPEGQWIGPGCRYVGVDPRVYIAADVRAPWKGPLPEDCVPTEEDLRRSAVGVALRRWGDAVWKLWHFGERLRALTTTPVVDSSEAA